CSSSANAIMLAARLIRSNRLDRVVAGGCDALTRFTLNGFLSLKILDFQACRPFDETRAGLNLGEGAGFLVLESEKSLAEGNKKAICELTGYANTCDAYHQTASSPEGDGPFRAMQGALEVSGVQPAAIDYINAHGTGTRNNDLSEGTAITRLFNPDLPRISSTKPFTGHALGAAGGMEAVLSCLSIMKDIIYPNLGFSSPMNELNLIPETKLVENAGVHHVMTNAFGFGGNNTSLIFSRC
ncbi:MAG: beta-ketoacyl-[acyl-carrier-protein] synthase family protein, partial [bacterium]